MLTHTSDNNNSEDETIPDEEFRKKIEERNEKCKSCNFFKIEGPNINLKCFRKRYSTEKKKKKKNKKKKIKKKTELCKNWEIYHDCFYKDECSFAHGIEELRQNFFFFCYKCRLCKSFNERSYCTFGQRCNYRHIIKEERLFTYKSIINFNCKELLNESNKKENEFVSLIQLYKQILLKRKIKM